MRTVEGERGGLVVGGLGPAHAAVAAVSRRRGRGEDKEQEDEGQARRVPRDDSHGPIEEAWTHAALFTSYYFGERRAEEDEEGIVANSRSSAGWLYAPPASTRAPRGCCRCGLLVSDSGRGAGRGRAEACWCQAVARL